MAYEKQTWEDRVVQNPMTYNMQTNDDGTITLIPAPGTVTKEGNLITAERMNHIEKGIEDIDNGLIEIGSKIGKEIEYSTEEQVIGKWKNGKVLYRKIFEGTKKSGADLAFTIADCDEVVDIYVKLSDTSTHAYLLPWRENDTTYGRVEVSRNNIVIKTGTSSYSNGTILAIVTYTKTTN